MFPSCLKSSDIHHTKVLLHPFHQKINFNSIKTLLGLLKTCFGPFAKLKIISNVEGGHVSVTSSASRLFRLISVQNTFLKLIISSLNTHLSCYGNGGVFCSLLTLIILTQSLESFIGDTSVVRINKRFGNLFIELLQSQDNNCVFDVSSFTISYLQPLIYSIISSKPGCFFTKQHEQDMTLLLMKSFISAFPDDVNGCLGKIYFHTEEGSDPSKSELLNGILVYCPVTNNDVCIKNCIQTVRFNKLLKIAIFSTSLAGDATFPSVLSFHSNANIWSNVILYLETVINRLITDCVNIVICQKVIHPNLKKKLKNKQILVIDRLGAEATFRIEQTSGATAVSSISNEMDITYGFLTSLEEYKIEKKNYLLFQNTSRPVWTVSIYNLNEESLAETKVVCQQAVDTFYRLLKDSKACCGGGCTEIYTNHFLESLVMQRLAELSTELDCSSTHLLKALQSFTLCIQETVLSLYPGSKLSFATETVYGHLWELNDDFKVLKCKCEKYTSEAVHSSQWRLLQRSPQNLSVEALGYKNSFIADVINKPQIVDELCVKLNAFKVAVETSSSLLNIGLLITP